MIRYKLYDRDGTLLHEGIHASLAMTMTWVDGKGERRSFTARPMGIVATSEGPVLNYIEEVKSHG